MRAPTTSSNEIAAGAVDVLGRRLGLPPALSGHNSYWLWGPRGYTGEVMLLVGGSQERYQRWFEEVRLVETVPNPHAMPYERDLQILLARRPRVSLLEVWPELKHFE